MSIIKILHIIQPFILLALLPVNAQSQIETTTQPETLKQTVLQSNWVAQNQPLEQKVKGNIQTNKAVDKRTYIKLIFIAFLLLCIATQAALYWSIHKKNEHLKDFIEELTIINSNLRMTNQRIVKETHQTIKKKEALFRKEEHSLQQQIFQKNRELTSNNLSLIQKNQYLKELRKMINQVQFQQNPKDVQKQLNKIANLINFGIKVEKDWEGFYSIFHQLNPEFYKDLKRLFPTLTKNDLRVCALLKLNLAIKDIAELLGIAEESVYMKCYRIRKKMSLDSEQKLCEYLIAFEDSPKKQPYQLHHH